MQLRLRGAIGKILAENPGVLTRCAGGNRWHSAVEWIARTLAPGIANVRTFVTNAVGPILDDYLIAATNFPLCSLALHVVAPQIMRIAKCAGLVCSGTEISSIGLASALRGSAAISPDIPRMRRRRRIDREIRSSRCSSCNRSRDYGCAGCASARGQPSRPRRVADNGN